MASRSLKPASYLASAAQQAPNRSPRPSFTRSSSNSSTISTRSEDSIVATLRGLSTADGKEKCKSMMESSKAPSRSTTPGTYVLFTMYTYMITPSFVSTYGSCRTLRIRNAFQNAS
ncbi:hypothetical protein WAI453_011738 [Rhynchosporium graminicola]